MAWNKPSGKDTGISATRTGMASSRLNGTAKLIVIALAIAVVAIAGITWLFLDSPDKAQPVVEKKNQAATIKAVTPAAAPKAENELVEHVDDKAQKRRAFAAKLKAMKPEERFDCIYAEMAKSPIDYKPTGQRIYATATEQMMDWVFTTTPGDLPPMLPPIPDYELAHMTEILINHIKATEDDDEATVASKEIVQQAKKELVNYISEGGDSDEFLQYYRGQLEQAHMQYEEARSAVVETMKNDPELAADFLEKVNAKLEEKGVKPVKIHPKMAEKYGISFE